MTSSTSIPVSCSPNLSIPHQLSPYSAQYDPLRRLLKRPSNKASLSSILYPWLLFHTGIYAIIVCIWYLSWAANCWWTSHCWVPVSAVSMVLLSNGPSAFLHQGADSMSFPHWIPQIYLTVCSKVCIDCQLLFSRITEIWGSGDWQTQR